MLQCGTLEDCLLVLVNPPVGEPLIREDKVVELQELPQEHRNARIASLARELGMPNEVQRHLQTVPLDRCDLVSRLV